MTTADFKLKEWPKTDVEGSGKQLSIWITCGHACGWPRIYQSVFLSHVGNIDKLSELTFSRKDFESEIMDQLIRQVGSYVGHVRGV